MAHTKTMMYLKSLTWSLEFFHHLKFCFCSFFKKTSNFKLPTMFQITETIQYLTLQKSMYFSNLRHSNLSGKHLGYDQMDSQLKPQHYH